MEKLPNFAKCYAILGVFPDDDWATVRNAYLRQIRRWHPDRIQNHAHQALAEEKTKELNSAYQELSQFHRRHGTLPPDESSERKSSRASQSDIAQVDFDVNFNPVDGWAGTASDISESSAPKRRRFGGPAAAVTLLALAYLLWEGLWPATPEYDEPSYPMEAGTGHADKDSSEILFRRHSGQDKSAIKVGRTATTSAQTGAQQPSVSPPSPPGSSSRLAESPALLDGVETGSTKTEVLALQGPPLRQTEYVWYYGKSRIYFRDGKVTGWYESPGDPIRFNRDTGRQQSVDSSVSSGTFAKPISP